MYADVDRRKFLTSCAISAAGIAISLPPQLPALDASSRRWSEFLFCGDGGTLRDSRVRALTDRALDTARSAGAEYADVRVTYTRTRKVTNWNDAATDSIQIGFSIRALIRGYWGLATTPLLTEDEVVRVGRTAAVNAKTLVTHGRERPMDWLPIPTVQEGDWTTPIEVDPFSIPIREVAALLYGEEMYVGKVGRWNDDSTLGVSFLKQDRVFASTEGSYGIQTRYITSCGATLVTSNGAAPLRTTGKAQAGWEHVRDQPWRTAIPELLEEIEAERRLPVEGPLDVGRYDIVFGAEAMAWLLSATVGAATQIGRALGYRANTAGTSYLGPHVLAMLGTLVASSVVSLTANRSRLRALATVPWDDEGVRPEDFALIKDGVLVDYLTTREQAPWLKPWYAKQGVAVRSRGCASSADAHAVMREHTPNLEMHPGIHNRSFDDLIADMGSGVAIHNFNPSPIQIDWQCLNGLVAPNQMYRIRGGKRVARITVNTQGGMGLANALLFRTPELLTGIMAIGGAQSLRWFEGVGTDGAGYGLPYSVGAVPAAVKQMTIIDPSRRA